MPYHQSICFDARMGLDLGSIVGRAICGATSNGMPVAGQTTPGSVPSPVSLDRSAAKRSQRSSFADPRGLAGAKAVHYRVGYVQSPGVAAPHSCLKSAVSAASKFNDKSDLSRTDRDAIATLVQDIRMKLKQRRDG